MLSWSAVKRRARALFDRSSVEREMEEELALHLELQEREHQRRRGLDTEAAHRAAIHSFGGVDHVREAYRDARGVRPVEDLMQDVRYALRTLARQRIFSAAAVGTLAIGLAATTAILALVDAAWLGWSRSYPNAERLTLVYKTFRHGPGATSPVDFRDWQHAFKSFEPLAGYLRTGARITTATEPAMVEVAATTFNYLGVLGLRPILGRFYRQDEEQWGSHGVVVISERLWRTDFGADAGVVGRMVTMDDAPVEIIGVVPNDAWFSTNPPHVYVPLAFPPNDPRNARHSHFIWTLGRLRPGTSIEEARVEARTLASRLIAAHPELQGTSIDVRSLEEAVLGDVKPTLRMLLGAVALLLVIACANVANLMLVRGSARLREMAVRSALGASMRRIAQQLVTESLVLALAGGALGIALGTLLLRVVGTYLPSNLPRVTSAGLSIDWAVAAASFVIIVACGLACGLLPGLQLAWAATGRGNADALREGSRGVAGGKRVALVRSSLVVAQIAIAMVLLVVSGLFARSLMQLQREDAGVRGAENVMSVYLPLPRARVMDSAAHVRFLDEALRRVSAIPGVASAGVSSHLPLTSWGETKPFWREGKPPATNAELPSVVGRMESARSLQTIGAAPVRGRFFEETDRGGAPKVAIINERIAKLYFAGEDPIGKRISLHPPAALRPGRQVPPGGWPMWTVVGVVKDVKYASPRDEPESAVYVHYPQGKQVWNWGPSWLVVKTGASPASAVPAIRSALREVDPTLPLGTMLPLDQRMALSLRAPRFTAALVTGFAIVAVLLSAIGLYGVIAYAVSQETRTFGIRIALGASSGDVARHVVSRGARIAVIGLAGGLALAFLATRSIESQLFGVAAVDPATYAIAGVALLCLALLASYLPARRAARVDPVIALRME